MAKDTKGEYREFRELLRRGIGTRTQKAFAEEAGISKEHLNRLLNNKEISRPSAAILKNMASHMNTITERMLLEACGYEIEPIADRVKRCEAAIKEGLGNLVSADYLQPWKSVADALQTMDILYMEENGKFEFQEEELCSEDGHRWAEKEMRYEYHWGDGENLCTTMGTIYYSRTENGNLIFLDFGEPRTTIRSKKEVEKTRMEERLLKAIFGDDDEKQVITTTFGYGFHYPETPPGFVDFLNEYRGTFCTNKARSKMLLQIIDEGKDADEVFADFETDKHGDGTGGAVAEILSSELGIYFYYYRHDEKLSEEDSPNCIMVEDGTSKSSTFSREEFLLNLHHAADVLQIPQFGHIYHSYLAPVQMRLYDTKSFGYEFRE